MAFDLATAKPIAPPQAAGFDLSTARPVNETAAKPDSWKDIGEAALKFTTGTTGGLAGDIAGLGAMGYDIAANAIMHPFSGATPGAYADPAKVRERVSSALTYQPSNPQSLSTQLVDAPGKIIGGAGDYIKEKVTNAGGEGAHPYLGDIAGAAPLAVASLFGVKAGTRGTFDAREFGGAKRTPIPEVAPGTPAMPAAVTPEQTAIKTATDAGYKLSPSQVANKVGATVEGLSGQAASERLLSKKNVPITDGLAKKALGIEGDAQLTPAKFTELRVKANKAYNDMAKTGVRQTSDEFRQEIANIDDRTGSGSFAEDASPAVEKLKTIYASKKAFDAGDAVDKIRQLRRDAKDNLKSISSPEQKAVGVAQRKIADALDNELERHAADIGQPELATQYKAARVQLAKLHTVQDALQGTNVSAKKIWQQWKRGAPLEGELLTVAKTYDSFQHVLQDASKIRGKHPFSAVDAFIAAGGAAVNPALLGTVLARPAARAALASDFYQRSFVRPKGAAEVPQPVNALAPLAPSIVPQSRERKSR